MTRVANSVQRPTVEKSKEIQVSEGHAVFRPPWYLRSGHIQTMLGPFAIPRRDLPSTRRIEVPLPRGGHTYLYETCPEIARQRSDAILLIHGLGGSHSSPYLTRIAGLLADAGHRAIRVDLPGCGPSADISDMPAHAGCSPEVRGILEWGHGNLGIDRWKIAGFSLGGNITLKLLSELAAEGANRPNADSSTMEFSSGGYRQSPTRLCIDRAVVVAPPIDLHECCKTLEKGLRRVYNRFFVRILRKLAAHRSSIWPRWAEIAQSDHRPVRTIRDFDNVFTSRIAGFADALDYYEKCSTWNCLDQIRIPTSILIDMHDPIVPSTMFRKAQWTDCIDVTVTKHGGHIGYLHRDEEGKLGCWLDRWVVQALLRKRILKYRNPFRKFLSTGP